MKNGDNIALALAVGVMVTLGIVVYLLNEVFK